MLIDTHAHVNFADFKEDAEAAIQRALDAGVSVINVGTQISTSREAVTMADKFEKNVYAVIGIHPVHTYTQKLQEEETHFKTRQEIFDHDAYAALAQNPKVVGIGECGLDYFRLPVEGNIEEVKKMQADAFIAQLRLAKELDKALVIHSRSSKDTDDACLDILKILEQEGVENLRFVLHSYTGSPKVATRFIALGAYMSFNGIITFDKTGNMEKVVQGTPLNRMVLETDCPYLAPVPHRGKKNEPLFVQHVAQKAAEIKGVTLEEITSQTTRNAQSLFRI